MRRGIVVLAALVLGTVLGPLRPALAAPARAATDAYSVATPEKPWQRAPQLDAAGQLTWAAGREGSQALLRVGYEGVVEDDPGLAMKGILDRARAGIRDELADRDGVERGGFEPDSMVSPSGLRWRGFRVTVRTRGVVATVTRWVALHPAFPARRRAFLVSFDETAPPTAARSRREAEARACALSLAAAGRGLSGDLAEAWLDARAAAFAARIDSAQALCWSARPNAASGRAALAYGPGLVPGGDFFSLSELVPADSLADPAPAEYGVAFDRNADGRIDLWLLNRGLLPFSGRTMQPAVVVFADDDFDGIADGAILEEADRDGDGRVDARILVRDRDQDGRADEAHAFVDAATNPRGDRLSIDDGRVRVRRPEDSVGLFSISELFRDATSRRGELDRARARCAAP